ncbi:hypothetical protein HAX54_027582 [Datura stramonium]|uniref:Transmembrane protein n=1 Tax=Datura stramonium TaxID=4076 RepID=A0ABS8V4Q8_DATST|nr:hypothetical protein [Datura stramonium]
MKLEYQNQQSTGGSSMASNSPIKKILLLSLSSVSLFSLLFSFLNIYSLELYLSAIPFQLVVDNKHYIFLICNGILVLLAKTSGIEAKEEELEDEDDVLAINEEQQQQQQQHYSMLVVLEDKQEGAILNEEKEMEYFNINALCTDEEEEDDDDDEALNKLSTEELNKKFEEFIRRMKEEISIEPPQQLVILK